jgi:hypothetical protein
MILTKVKAKRPMKHIRESRIDFLEKTQRSCEKNIVYNKQCRGSLKICLPICLKNLILGSGVKAHVYNPITQEVETGMIILQGRLGQKVSMTHFNKYVRCGGG